MRFRCAVVSILLLFLAVSVARAQSADTIRLGNLEEVIRSAVASNPTQAVYRQQVKQARFNYKSSQGFLYPGVSAGFDGTDNLHLATTPIPGEIFGRPGTTVYARFGKKYVYNTGLSLSENLLDWTAVVQMQIARGNAELAQLQQQAFEQSLKEQVARLYFSAQIARAALQINIRDQQLSDSVLVLARQKLDEGTSDLLSYNQAAINSNTVRQSQAQSRQLLDQSLENLKILLGKKTSDELVLVEEVHPDTADLSLALSLGADKNLDVYRQQLTIASLQGREQKAAFYPRIAATGYFGDQQFRDNFGMSFGSNAWNTYNYLGLNVTVPLFQGFQTRNKYKSVLVQKDIAQLQYDAATTQSRINDRLLQENYTSYLRMVKASAGNFMLYGQNVRLNRQKYEEGVIGFDVYSRSFQDYLTAENVYLDNLSQLLSVKATIISRQ